MKGTAIPESTLKKCIGALKVLSISNTENRTMDTTNRSPEFRKNGPYLGPVAHMNPEGSLVLSS
jgi:hypothetical protein